jgi:hypothetical protein
MLFPQAPAWTAPAGAAARVAGVKLRKRSGNGRCVFDVKYPQVAGLASRQAQASINTLLKKEFYPAGYEQCVRDSKTDKSVYHEETGYRVGLNRQGVLSIKYESTGYAQGAAHPNNTFKAFTFDLKTGKAYRYEDLFRRDADYRKKIQGLLLSRLTKTLGADSEELARQAAAEPRHSFYLTNKGLVIFNLFDVHAAQGVEAALAPGEIADVVNPEGPLRALPK